MRTNRYALVSSYILLLILMTATGYVALRQTTSRESFHTQLARGVFTPTAASVQSSPTPSDAYPPPNQTESAPTPINENTPYPGSGMTSPNQSQSSLAYPGQGTEVPTDIQTTSTPSLATQLTVIGSTPTALNNQTPMTSTPEVTPTPVIIRTEIQASDPQSFNIVSGRVQFVEFFAYWSPISKSMAPVMNLLADKYKEQINFVFLDIDVPENSLYKQLIGDRLPPIFILLDPQGGVINAWEGFVSSSELESALQSVVP